MASVGRKLVPYTLLAVSLAAGAWAVSFSKLPPADFTFCNETEIQTVDPAIVTGQPEGRIIRELFECLVNWHPETLAPIPGVAERWDLADNKTTYTFHLRKDAQWSDGTPVTAEDFRWSYQRFLHPETAAQYAYQLWYVRGAEEYTKRRLSVGDPVEIELTEKLPEALPHARNKVVYGKLVEIGEEDGPAGKPSYLVDLEDGGQRRFSKAGGPDSVDYVWLLPDFRQVGIQVLDTHTLRLELKNPTPYFVQLTGYYPLSPVNRRCVETYGYPVWTKPENIVTNGPYLLVERRIRDRIRLQKNPTYWNRDNVRLNTIDALAVDSTTTALNLYETGQCDWVPKVPNTVIPLLRGRPDFHSKPYLSIYYYRLNTTQPPLDDPRVRRALNWALDKREIAEKVARGEVPATSFVPPGIKGYRPGACGTRNVEEARRLLAEAGYPGGQGFPKIEILYNTMESHRSIAELIQSQWKESLGIDTGLSNQEWGVFLDTVRQLKYNASRAGWTGDYVDPNTFLDMYVTGGENNQTGWGNEQYDKLIERAQQEPDPEQRFELFRQAETILLEEMPIIPLYYYSASELVRPNVRGWYTNVQDMHPLSAVWLEPQSPTQSPSPGTPGEGRGEGLGSAAQRPKGSGVFFPVGLKRSPLLNDSLPTGKKTPDPLAAPAARGRGRAMTGYILKRLAWMAVTLWVVFTITFFLMRTVPGGPFASERAMSPEIEANFKAHYGYDRPIFEQYLRMLGDTLRGDLGLSYKMGDFTVNEIIVQGFPISAALGIVALVFALTLGLTAGIVSAVRRQTVADFALMSIATIGIALPNFIVAGVATILFVFLIPLFPAGGWGSMHHLILPGLCLGAPYAAYVSRLTRTGMLDVLGQDYIRTARAKGLPPSTVILRHAIKGAMLPVVSYLGPAIAGILTGSLVIERIFAIPGLGVHFINAASQKDYTLAMGLTLLYTLLLCSMNLIVDVSYRFLDPRVKLE